MVPQSLNGALGADGPPAKKARLDQGLHTVHSVCLVIDYGSQYTQLIARRVRELGVYSMLLPGDISLVRPGANGLNATPIGYLVVSICYCSAVQPAVRKLQAYISPCFCRWW